MEAPVRIIILAAALAALVASTRAQQNPGLTAHPSGLTLNGTNFPVKPAFDFSRRIPAPALDSAPQEETYFDAAMRGEAWAQTKLGKSYLEQTDFPERRQIGIELLKMAAAQKDAEALYILARVSAEATASQSSSVNAVDKLRKAAEFGSPDAQYELAAMMMNDADASELEKKEAMDWARKAAYRGNAKAQHSVGVTLLRQASDPAKAKEGISLLEKAAAQNHREALMALAGILTRGEFGVAKDQQRAGGLLLPRAEAGDPEFQFGLATLCLYGDQLEGTREDGLAWLRKSAEAGHPEAQELVERIAAQSAMKR